MEILPSDETGIVANTSTESEKPSPLPVRATWPSAETFRRALARAHKRQIEAGIEPEYLQMRDLSDQRFS